MIYLLSLLTVLSSVTTLLLFQRLRALEAPRNNPLAGYDMDHLSILLEFSPLLTDIETENSLRELNELLRNNDGLLSNALDNYFQGALEDTYIRQELIQAVEDIEQLQVTQEDALSSDDICHLLEESDVIDLIDDAICNLNIKIVR